ncbi:MAG: hypothetical protein QF898_01280 [SAR202 cluster bacterium]|nr:hypothetical protein [SAR202 cluster bacterium]
MSAIDFANSYMTWFGALNGSMSRIQLDATCTLFDDEKGTEEPYYLIAPCRSEHTHSDGQLITMPNYDFRGIFGATEYTLIRNHWVANPDDFDDPGYDNTGGRTSVEAGLFKDRFDDVQIDLCAFEDVTELLTDDDVVEHTLRNVPLMGQTELSDETSGLRAVLEYPIKTMNVLKSPVRYQVDTGALIVPDFSTSPEYQVERFDVAHVVYNQPDRGEFILRKPRDIPRKDGSVWSVDDYSERMVCTGRNRLFAASRPD